MVFELSVTSPQCGRGDENAEIPQTDSEKRMRSALSEEQLQNEEDTQSTEDLHVTEKNTFLEVDESRGSKTLSIFRCYTSPVYRRLFSGASSSGVNESTADLASWAEDQETAGGKALMSKSSTRGLDSVAEEENQEDAAAIRSEEEDKVRLSEDNLEKMMATMSANERKTKKNKHDKVHARQFTADIEPFGKFEKFDIEPLNSGGRRGSMEPPAPLDDLSFLTKIDASAKNKEKSVTDNTLMVRRDSKESAFHSAVASPSVNGQENPKEQPTPLTLPAHGEGNSKKVLVREEHGGVPEHLCTTIMVRNIPNKYSQRMLHEVFTNHGFDQTFDFLYVPADFFHRLNLGYCFVNFKKPEYAQAFARQFQDYHLPAFKSKKKIQISLANTQGFMPNVMKLEHTALCSQYVSPEFHPICIDPDTNSERPFLSFFPGFQAPPPNRIENPEFWAKKDTEHVTQWEGESLYPPVFVPQNDGTSKNNRYVHSPAVTPPNAAGHHKGARHSHSSKPTHGNTGRRSHKNHNNVWM